MQDREMNVFYETTALRTQMLETLTDVDLTFALPNNPSLGDLCRGMGHVEAAYINSFKTFKHDWGVRAANEERTNTVEGLKVWYKTLDEEFAAILKAIPDEDLQTKTIDRGGSFIVSLGAQFHIYREALLIFCGKCNVYLLALGKPLSPQWLGWIG